jgi:hypothetical protein
VFAICRELAYLFRLDIEGGLETIVLGSLQGGEYRERITEGERVEGCYKHPQLSGGQIVVRGSAGLSAVTNLRSKLRTWAETPAPPS